MSRRRVSRRVTGRLMSVLAVIAVVGLIPLTGVQLLITQGTSMSPHFRTGDVAVTYVPRSYRVGDVVAYRSGTLDMVVLHRIVGTQDGGYVTKGDNNSW